MQNDHLLGYGVTPDKSATPAGIPFPSDVTRTISDQFGSHGTCRIKKEKTLHLAADKNGEGFIDPFRHYISYQISCDQKVVETHTFFDQIAPAGVSIAAVKERSLLVPTSINTPTLVDPPAPAAGTNHYLCYKAKGPKIAPVTVQVQDQFAPSARAFTLRKISAVCNPADKNDEDPTAVTDPDHFVCYRVKANTTITPTTARTNNLNFGLNTLAPKKEKDLCIPAFKDVIPPSTTTTLGECGGGPGSCAGTCPSGLMCAPVDDFPPYCGCVPDGSQPCESEDWPTCNGQCPTGQECGAAANVPGGACICVPTGTTACGDSSFPTCGGACLTGESCYASRVIGYLYCSCAPTGSCSAVCSTQSGACPLGEVCQTVLDPCGCAPYP
jgi:hypothetical protein